LQLSPTHARQQQLAVAARQAAGDRHHAPEGDGRGHDPLARATIDEPRDRDPRQHVEQHESEPDQQADLGVAESEVRLDRRDQQRHQLPVEVVEHQGDHENEDRPPAPGW
jgi:hypothetical protein